MVCFHIQVEAFCPFLHLSSPSLISRQSSILSDPIPLKGNNFHIPPEKSKSKTKVDNSFFCSLRHKGHCLPTFGPIDLDRTSRTWSPDGKRWGGCGGRGLTDERGSLKEHLGVGQGCAPRLWSYFLLTFLLLSTSALPFQIAKK